MSETLATYSVPEHHVDMFTANVRASITRQGGLLTGLVTRGAYTGSKIQVVDFIGPIEFSERSTPYGDTQVTELEHTSRWITGTEYDAAVFIDRLDTLKMIYDPTSPYVERMREAWARKTDDIIMLKFFDTARSGRDGNTLTPYNTNNTVTAGGTGLTVSKLRAMRKLMRKRHIDLRAQRPLIAVTAEQADNLLGETEVKSADYNAVKPLVDGEVTGFMGFNFVPFEEWKGTGIPKDTTSGVIRQCPVWVPEGMHMGSWQELVITISTRPDKNNIKQAHATFTCGATRLEEDKVFQLQCTEA